MWDKLQDPYHLVALYTALNALIILVLGILVTRARVVTQVDIGDGGKPEMAGPLRAHGNNIEWTPMGILLLWMMAPLGGMPWMFNVVGISLTLGRLIHGIALSTNTGPSTLRVIGMLLTWIAYIAGIALVIYLGFIYAPDTSAITGDQ
ncbi:MAG TPA: MAPEG family protein [Rhizomicrobium sp.]|jgi:hypothetical protein